MLRKIPIQFKFDKMTLHEYEMFLIFTLRPESLRPELDRIPDPFMEYARRKLQRKRKEIIYN